MPSAAFAENSIKAAQRNRVLQLLGKIPLNCNPSQPPFSTSSMPVMANQPMPVAGYPQTVTPGPIMPVATATPIVISSSPAAHMNLGQNRINGALGPIHTSTSETKEYHIKRGEIKPVQHTTGEVKEETPSKDEKEKREKIELLEEALATVGSVEAEDIEGMEEAEKIEYLREFILPVVASIDTDNAKVIAEALLAMDIGTLLEAMQNGDGMYNAIMEVKGL